jgi:biopolymer transport protein ExbD
MRARSPQEPALDVDMTPLIDVVFLLMIFFMVISTLNEMERQAKLELPEAYQAIIRKDVARERMVINVEQDGQIRVFGSPMSLGRLREALATRRELLRKLEHTGEAPILLRGDRQVRFGEVRGILQAVYDEGFTKIMFAAYQKRRDSD